MRLGISFLVYHIEMIYTNDGEIAASTTPTSARTIMSCRKEVHDGVHPTTMPQRRMLMLTYFPTRRVCRRTVIG